MRAVEGHASEILSASVEKLLAYEEVGFKDLVDQVGGNSTKMLAFDLGGPHHHTGIFIFGHMSFL